VSGAVYSSRTPPAQSGNLRRVWQGRMFSGTHGAGGFTRSGSVW
jgi:hypothetical protein